MVIEVVTSASGMPWNSRSMSSTLATLTPSRPTSPSERSESGSCPISVGISNAVDRPVCPSLSRKWKRRLVSSGVPKPANIRIVHSLPRYIVS
jgi:hypothetical protein